jgi:DNA-binding MarR family transcriptional regulator
MVTTLDALERLGVIQRVRSTTDRRKTHVLLTTDGRTMRDTLHGYASDVLERALGGISDDEVVTLRRVLQQIKGNLA